MCRKSFPSRFSAVSIHNGPLYELGLPFIGPWTWIRQAHFTRLVGLYFYSLQQTFTVILPFILGMMILLEIWFHMLGNRSQLATGALETMQACLRVLLSLLNFLHDICLLWFLCFNAHLEIHPTFIWLHWCLIFMFTFMVY